MRALVVDDDRQLRELISEYLEHEGFDVTTARDGQEALRLVQGGAALDVIVLDDEMPRLKGTTCCPGCGLRGTAWPSCWSAATWHWTPRSALASASGWSSESP